jgi:predicted transcriptional regulator of viral defense system
MDHAPVRFVFFSGTAWSFRVDPTEIDGVDAYITSPARTVADCFRLARLAGPDTGREAFDDALSKGRVTIEELTHVERALPCLRLRALLARYAPNPSV